MLDRLEIPDVEGALRDLVLQIPRGRVTTYKALAEALGDPGAVRFVAGWLAAHAAELPVHRVVHASGAVGKAEFAGPEEFAERLRREGVRVEGLKVTPLIRYFTADFHTDRPLERLRREQEEIARRTVLRPLPGEIERVAGVDAAYTDSEGIGIYVLCDKEGEPLDYVEVRREIRFPYIPTYLSYRELPLYLAAAEEAEGKGLAADVILVDGNGILHPRRVGIATHLGVLLDRPTVGVAKKLLCGEVNTEGMTIGEWRPVVLEGETVGAAMRTARNRTIFISPGHLADVPSSVDLVASLLRDSPLPEPLRWAHELAAESRTGA
ncbi:endonuclease V [Candidatus Bipolaricaulota sp. J31]